jgi:hypothetical protein
MAKAHWLLLQPSKVSHAGLVLFYQPSVSSKVPHNADDVLDFVDSFRDAAPKFADMISGVDKNRADNDDAITRFLLATLPRY